ncbi:acyl-CoA wax alcohol acyltransferase 2 [Pteronotus mesoamericanus]|uniref:acyl-CoA wax alcohol acyltransferase 2 n=1 Tax=Pteronotus mesoamericanus TaxID=1884717 RepID=UPI0023EA952D|nr:acyl-CoA wax alcohol acyltransferase 2 [Pteronotus parnellii mesoamericanus]
MFLPSKKDFKTAMEVFAVVHWFFFVFIVSFAVIFVNIYLMVFTRYWPVPVLLLMWLAFDWKTPERGGRRFLWMRRCHLWKEFADYFPLRLLKTHDLSPNHNYILAYHPHGLLCHSVFGSLATEGVGFSKIFPGITCYVLTLGIMFWVPVIRDYIMSVGSCSVSSASIDYLLTQKGTGNMLVTVVGGLAECKYSFPGSTTLFLKNRTGFIRKALQHGVAVIPSYAFGEVDLYNQHIFTPGGLVSRFQEWSRKVTHIYPTASYGCGLTKNSWGFLPHSRPVTTVVGEPLPMPKIENPSQEVVHKYHTLYLEALRKLFDQHKTQYGFSETQKLVIA